MEAANVTNCKNIFISHEPKQRTQFFTELWAQVINQKENSQVKTGILQTNIRKA